MNPELVLLAKVLDGDISFGDGKQLIVDVPVNPRGIVDIYVDAKIGVTVGILGSNILLAIHIAARAKDLLEPIPREEMVALTKLLAEAGLEETTILRWDFIF